MKLLRLVVFCLLLAGLTGCLTATRSVATVGLSRVLANNPRLVEPVRDINRAIDGLLADGDAEITDAQIEAFVARIGAKHGLTEPERRALTGLLLDFARDVRSGLKVAVLRAGDARVAPYLKAFHEGVTAALAFYPQPQPES